MPTVWNFDEDDQTNSGGGSQYTRINAGRSEENLNNSNEGGLRIENEDGVELWFSIDEASNDSNGYMAWIDDSGSVSGGGVWNGNKTGDGNLYHAAYNGNGNPNTDVPDPDIVVIAPSERDTNGDIAGRFVGTADNPVELNFKSGLGIWKVTFHAEDGSTTEVEIGNDDRYDASFNNGNNVDWLIQWSDESASAIGTFTHITVESLTAALIDVKNPVFVLDDLSMEEYFCFLAGTCIDTPNGPVPIETLKPGDLVHKADGETTAIVWVGVQHIPTPLVMREKVHPVCIKADALSKGVPRRDLYVSPDHAILVDGVLVNAIVLVNGTTITQAAQMPMTGFHYYHIETEAHEVILAEGCPAETFFDASDRSTFDNYPDYLAEGRIDRIIPEMKTLRVTTPRLLPEAIKSRLRTSVVFEGAAGLARSAA